MDKKLRESPDRYITGNYGEDQFNGGDWDEPSPVQEGANQPKDFNDLSDDSEPNLFDTSEYDALLVKDHKEGKHSARNSEPSATNEGRHPDCIECQLDEDVGEGEWRV